MTTIRAHAPAKINLGFEVIGRRDDGFHEILTVFQTVDLFDTITITPSSTLSLRVNDESLQADSNLVLKAAQLLKDRWSVQEGAEIALEKRIPTSAGLGGASSDAASTLLALSEHWNLDPPTEELMEFASELGSDVPFFLTGGTALGKGRGEIVRPLSRGLDAWLVIATPKVQTSEKTASMYRQLTASDFSSGNEVERVAQLIEFGNLPSPAELPNPFRRHAFTRWPQLAEIDKLFEVAGAPGAALSGAGPSLYTILTDQVEANRVAEYLKAKVTTNVNVVACRTISHIPPLVRDNR